MLSCLPVWQTWAMLGCCGGNIKHALKLFDASLKASKRHAAAWHDWELMENADPACFASGFRQ